MNQTAEIRAMIATMLMVSPAEIQEGTSLAALNTSLGSAKLRLGLKRLGLAVPSGAAPRNFGSLLVALDGGSVAPPAGNQAPTPFATVQPRSGVVSAGLQVGLDVEEIGALPAAADYWDHEFYRGSFARSEIAYAVQQPEPRTHFAGFWCAKEALRKCDPSFAAVEFPQTSVAHDASGQPYLLLENAEGKQRLPHALSISHTTDVAAAIVVTGAAPAAEVVEIAATAIAAEIAPEKRKSRGLAKLFGI